jgi:hypothetical protein
MSLNVARFLVANGQHAIEYFSAERNRVTLRLVDGSKWEMYAREWTAIGERARFAHLEGCPA